MPPFVPLADGAQVEVVFTLFGEVVENRLWFVSRQPPITQAQVDALALGVGNWHTAEVMPLLAPELQLAAVEAKDWTSDPSPFLGVVTPLVNGGAASTSYSANVAVRVRFKGDSSQTFPDNANFVPGIPDDAVDGNIVSSTFKNDLRVAYADLIDLAAGFGPFPAWRWVVTSRQLDYAWRTEQAFARTDIIKVPSPYVNPRRRRLP